MTLEMTSTQVVETSATNNSFFQNYPHLDDHAIWTTDTSGFKPFTIKVLLLYWLVNLPSVVHSGVTVVELLDMLINVSWGWALRTLLPQTTNFHLQATRKTYLVARPGNLLFEISLRDENSLTIICLPFLICCCVVCNSSSLPLFFTLIFLVFLPCLHCVCVRVCVVCNVVTKTWNDLKPPKTIYNHLQPPQKIQQPPTTSKTSTTTRKQSYTIRNKA